MKTLKNPLLFYGLLTALAAGLAAIIIFGVSYLNRNPSVAVCQPGRVYTVTIGDTSLGPTDLTVKRCDQLYFVNTGDKLHVMAVGPYNQLTEYPGLDSTPLSPDSSFTVTLKLAGTYVIHDHLNGTLQLRIIIKP